MQQSDSPTAAIEFHIPALYITTEELEALTPERRARLHEQLRERFEAGKVGYFINTLAEIHQKAEVINVTV